MTVKRVKIVQTDEVQATMKSNPREKTLDFWDRVAQDWDRQVGTEGDANRMLNSDPVLWRFVGEIAGLDVLDAGCGTGYLSRKLKERGARVIGIDFSSVMIKIAHANAPDIDFRVDTCSTLATMNDNSMDLVVSNYVLMDTPDLDETVKAFARVLSKNGIAVVVFSHPCFPGGRRRSTSTSIDYRWDFSYFDRRQCIDPPWGHFTSEFIWFHRPLSDYWKAFKVAGFEVLEFEEPRLAEDQRHLAQSDRMLNMSTSCPFSVAFKLRKIL